MSRRTILLFVVVWATAASAQSILTIAGGGSEDGRPARLAQLSYPMAVTVDLSGNLYIADGLHNRLRKVSAVTGLISTIAGNGSEGSSGDGGPATLASIGAYCAGLIVDGLGNVYFTDSHRVRKVSAGSGIISTIAGTGVSGYSGDGGPATSANLAAPSGLALDSKSNLYIADYGNNRVRKVAADSRIITTVAGKGSEGFSGDGGPATAAELRGPGGVAFDSSDTLYIADTQNSRIRRVSAGSGTIATFAGNGSNVLSGDGGPALTAGLRDIRSVAVDSAANVYISEYGSGLSSQRIRRIAAGSGVITTFAGNGEQQFSGDNGPAVAAGLDTLGIALDTSGNLYIADAANNRIRRVNAVSGTIDTVAGNGESGFGDGGPAIAAGLVSPKRMAWDHSGNLYIADTGNNRVRKVAENGFISTVAGIGRPGLSGNGGPATLSELWFPRGVGVDGGGALYIAESGFRIRKVLAGTGIITAVAGNGAFHTFNGDGIPALGAGIDPYDVAVDDSGNLYIADRENGRIRRITASTGIIDTVAGSGNTEFFGDGGPAKAAGLYPLGVTVDASGNVYVVDDIYDRIRKIDVTTGIISTVAGGGFDLRDSVPATSASLYAPAGVAVDASRNLYIADSFNHRIRKVAAGSGLISTVAGNGVAGFSGDGGPATAASVSYPEGVALDQSGNLFIAANGRIRAVLACVTVLAPNLQQPSTGSASVSTAPKLAWSSVKGAFHYDVYLDTVNPPLRAVAADLTSTTYSPANLEPLTTYYWKIVAKGDPFCTPFSTATSDVRSFTTTGTCSVAAQFDIAGAVVAAGTAQLSWTPSARAGKYDVAIGTTNPPRVYARGVTATTLSVSGLASGTRYFWSVTAHATCDPARTTSTAVQSFTTAGSCTAPSVVVLNGPADNDRGVPATATLWWLASDGAASYDLYLGSGSNPPIYMRDLLQTSVTLPRLTVGAEYSWKVVATAACNASKSTASEVRRFIVSACGTPGATPAVAAAQASVAVGATYAITWAEAPGVDAAASYLVERATDVQFAKVIDRQETTSTSASFTSSSAETYYHRVISIAGCDRSRRSSPSDTVSVAAVAGAPVVIFTMQPQAVITKLGDKLEDQKTRFALESLGNAPVQVLIAPQLLGGSVPFFNVVDPFGGDPNFVTLEPHKAKTFEVHFSGPPNDLPASYQGSIYVTSAALPLAFTPQAYVNLKVGGDAAAIAPRLLVNGVESDFAFFPPATGDDAARPAIVVDLLNSGSAPMDVAAEIGPEAWLKLEKDWNASAVPASSFRSLRLSTQRTRAVAGSALPRYTYLTVRNKAGQSARLLIEDSGGVVSGRGRAAPPDTGELSLIVPSVRSGSGRSTALYLTNTAGTQLPLELVWTPEGLDGFDENGVKRVSLIVPPNDVVTLTDPLPQLFATTGDAAGSLEVRSSAEKLGALVVRSEVRSAVAGGGSFGYLMPVAYRGEGARVGVIHRVTGVISNSTFRSVLVVSETTGRDKASLRLSLFDKNGAKRGEQTIALGRYGSKTIDDVAAALSGGADIDAGMIHVEVTADGGAVLAVLTVSDRTSGSGASAVAQPVGNDVHLSALGRRIGSSAAAEVKEHLLVAGVTNEQGSTTVGVTTAAATNVKLTYRDAVNGRVYTSDMTVGEGQTRELTDVVATLTGSNAASHGTITIDAAVPVHAYARVRSGKSIDALPATSLYSEALTGGGAAKPVYAEGLEQSLDAAKGRRAALLLTELAGQSAVVTVRLYEPGNRTAAIAGKDFSIGANSELRLDNLFAAMGLDSGADDLEQRRKDRVNVVCVVTARSGSGLVQALAIAIDNRTGDRHTVQLQPAGGLPATSPQRPFVSMPARRRSVGR